MKRLLTSAAMFLCCMATSFAQFSGSGSGTEKDPYLILNPIHLNQLRNFLNQEGVYFKLMADIDLTEFLEDENPDQGWLPVGTSSAPFKGILDGNWHKITGLWISRPSTGVVGFFGLIEGATIKNVAIESSSIVGGQIVGGISGQSYGNSTINGCSFRGAVSGLSNVGGYVGYNMNTITLSADTAYVNVTGSGNSIGGFIGGSNVSTISGCILNDGVIRGNNNVGGFCGEIRSSYSISNTYIHANINGADYVGGICGLSRLYTSINLYNCGFDGDIVGSSYVGGLVGKIKDDYPGKKVIQKCFAIGSISATGDYVGGILGYNEGYNSSNYTNLSDSYHSGPVTGANYVGGLVGYKKYGETSNCYAIGSVAGTQYVGGLLGYQEGSTTLKKSVAINTRVTATTGDVSRVVGSNGGTIGATGTTDENKSYNKTIVISQGVAQDITDNEMNGTGVSATTLKLKATYVAMGWDFTDTWAIQETECYPYMKSQTAPPVIQSQVVSGATTVSGKCVDGGTVTLEIDGVKQQMVSTGNSFSFTVSPLQAGHEVRVSAKAGDKEQSYYTTEVVSFLGKGTEADPYQISTAADLTQVYRKGYYKLMNNIDLTDYINQFSPTEGWQSIGRDGSETIHFDGDGHKVTGLWCNSTRDNTGLFSCFANGEIKNLTVQTATGKQVKGGANTGILIGKMINGSIESCKVVGNVADGTPVGGIVGLMSSGSISKSQANVTISTTGGNSYVGGIVGEITSGTIDQCTTQGTLTATGATSYVGGLAGKNRATVTNCYSSAAVTSSYNAAGLIAYNYGSVSKSYATGDIASNNYGAGIIGYNDGVDAVISNCAAMNNKIDVTYESQQVQQGGGYGQRIIGGIKNDAPAPGMNNYALKTMQVSVNDVEQKVYDDIMNGTAKTAAELMQAATYTTLGWDMTTTWGINEGESTPYLRNIGQTTGTQDDNGDEPGGDEPGGNEPGGNEPGGDTGQGGEQQTGEDTDISQIANTVYIENIEGYVGNQLTLSVKMKNTVNAQGYGFDLYLPEGVSFAVDEDNFPEVEMSTERTTSKKTDTFQSVIQANGSLRVFATSTGGYTLQGNDGEIATVKVNVSENIEEGDWPIILREVTVTDENSNGYDTDYLKSTLTVVAYTPGDTNNDGKINVTDFTAIANHMLSRTPETFNQKAADLNKDNKINVTDLTAVANIILFGSPTRPVSGSARRFVSHRLDPQ